MILAVTLPVMPLSHIECAIRLIWSDAHLALMTVGWNFCMAGMCRQGWRLIHSDSIFKVNQGSKCSLAVVPSPSLTCLATEHKISAQ